jgi:endonuclease YncB( thermonuclease family)
MVPFFVHRLGVRVVTSACLLALAVGFSTFVAPKVDNRPAELRNPPKVAGARPVVQGNLLEVTSATTIRTTLGPVVLAGIRPVSGRCAQTASAALFRMIGHADLWMLPAGPAEYDAAGVRHDDVWAGSKAHLQERMVTLGLARPTGNGRWARTLALEARTARAHHRGCW